MVITSSETEVQSFFSAPMLFFFRNFSKSLARNACGFLQPV